MIRAVPDDAAAAWRIAVTVPFAMRDAALAAFDGPCAAVSAFEADDEGRTWLVEGFARSRPDVAELGARMALLATLHGVPEPAITIERVPPTDWLAATHAAFPPLRIGRFFIHGSHVDTVPPGMVPLRIDAATAFGSGEHPTTAGCLLALDRLAKRRRRIGRALDMGCGTGILAFAAARLFAAPVLAIDIDPESVRVARINACANRVGRLVRAEIGDGYRGRAVAGCYDLILANILARPLMRLAPDLERHMAPGGAAILSGLLAWQEAQVLAAHRAQGLALRHRIVIRGWSTLVLGRGGQGRGIECLSGLPTERGRPDRARPGHPRSDRRNRRDARDRPSRREG